MRGTMTGPHYDYRNDNAHADVEIPLSIPTGGLVPVRSHCILRCFRGVSVPEERSMSTKGSARSFEPRELKWSLSRYR